MGHRKSKRQRETALALPRPLPKAPPKTIMDSCHLTGERRDYRLPVMVIDDDDRIAQPKCKRPEDLRLGTPFAQGYRVSLPLRLHTRETDGALGGHAYSGPFIRFMDAGMPEKTKGRHAADGLSHQEYAERYWWSPEWAERELRAYFAADVVDIVLSVRRDHQTWDSAMVGSTRALGDVQAQERLMARHCRMLIRQDTARAA